MWAEAVTRQVRALPHTCNLYYAEPCARLAEMLCERTGMKKVFFSNSGAEANECMIKAARKYGEATGRSTIVTLKDSFHGRTIATLAATGQDVFHQHFGPFPAGFVYAAPNDLDSVRALCEEDDACAVMLEVVQGEGGVRALDGDFLRGVEALCRERNMLLCIDEVQTGNGRSGELYAYMAHGLNPDIVSTAKGLGGGLPIGATLLGEKVQNVLTYGDHGSTFGGNPVACAGAVSILSRLDEALFAGVRERADYIRGELEGAKGVIGVERPGADARRRDGKERRGESSPACLARGVLVLTAKSKVRLLPPLNIGWDDLEKADRHSERGDRGVKRRYLVLSSGAVFEGYALGAEGEGLGELVFTTNMCGYPETLTDPSYAGQIIMQTFPLIGNYGIIPEDFEGECRARGYVVREACEAPSNFRCRDDAGRFPQGARRARHHGRGHARDHAHPARGGRDERADLRRDARRPFRAARLRRARRGGGRERAGNAGGPLRKRALPRGAAGLRGEAQHRPRTQPARLPREHFAARHGGRRTCFRAATTA